MDPQKTGLLPNSVQRAILSEIASLDEEAVDYLLMRWDNIQRYFDKSMTVSELMTLFVRFAMRFHIQTEAQDAISLNIIYEDGPGIDRTLLIMPAHPNGVTDMRIYKNLIGEEDLRSV